MKNAEIIEKDNSKEKYIYNEYQEIKEIQEKKTNENLKEYYGILEEPKKESILNNNCFQKNRNKKSNLIYNNRDLGVEIIKQKLLNDKKELKEEIHLNNYQLKESFN